MKESPLYPASREFHWVSSVNGDKEKLEALHSAMMSFYSEEKQRSSYQGMIDRVTSVSYGSSTYELAQYMSQRKAESILEVGCATGRLFEALRDSGYQKKYVGSEVADYVIASNQESYPEAEWIQATAYDLPVPDASADIVCSEFVLEHLVFPKEALVEMMRAVRPGGELILIFPDFISAGRLNSQVLGFSPRQTAMESLKKGYLIDGIVSLYDSRIRLPRRLRTIHEDIGPFPVNLRPACLTYPNITFPDIDAVYIASKQEVESWASRRGHKVSFPKGKEEKYREVAFVSIIKK